MTIVRFEIVARFDLSRTVTTTCAFVRPLMPSARRTTRPVD